MTNHVLLAIFRRNFASYFSSPLGYVFICAFVLLSAFAAFWPNRFFNANLANLDQLNRHLPWIMLVFIPAITMSVWAEERRRGTDELLLTLPARDLDVVLGKYLAALAIFTVSLLFSLSNVLVLIGLGEPDIGLMLGSYVGYWTVGAAMLAVGMVASFLTSNLTVGFVLGAALNAPLVFAAFADAIFERETALAVRSFSVAEQFGDFGRGVISLSAVVYFVGIVVVGLYLCMVMIGRRHAPGARSAAHFTVRAVCLVAVAVGVNVVAGRFDPRLDVTRERLSSLSPRTAELIERIDADRPVYIEAYVSPEVPEAFVQMRLNLLSMLREVSAIGGDRIVMRVNDTELFSEEAAEAEEQFGIIARPVQAVSGGRMSIDEIHLGAVFMCGLDKVVVPFFERGVPVEYEVIRSIATVSQQKRRRLGVLATDARLFGGFDMQSMSQRPNQRILNELQKQYEVVQVDPASPIAERYDALLAVQPSSLPQVPMDNFIDAVRRGQPTAIFEDPFPFLDANMPGTSQPRIPPGGRNPFQQQQQPEPKGDIRRLWSLLQVNVPDRMIVWDEYNPYPNIGEFPPEFVFIGAGSGAGQPFGDDNGISSDLQQIMLLFGGSMTQQPGSSLEWATLLETADGGGTLDVDVLLNRGIFGQPAGLNPDRPIIPDSRSHVMAARVRGSAPDGGDGTTSAMDVVITADTDVLGGAFFALRSQGRDDDAPINFVVDNVTYVLNVLDTLAGDDRFVEIRNRRPVHRTLTAVEAQTEQAQATAAAESRRFRDEYDRTVAEEQAEFDRRLGELESRPNVDPQQMLLEIETARRVGNQRLQATIDRLERERDRNLDQIERDLALEVRAVQDRYKLAAVMLPPIPPLLVAIVVYLRRRRLELTGVAKERLRST